jgi:hypothetical protein
VSAPILDETCTILCPHGGTATVVSTDTQASINGPMVLLQTDAMIIAGCVFNVLGVPSPCVTIQWVVAALQVTVNGIPVLNESSVGLCLNALGVPQGPAIVIADQMQVLGQ